MKKISQVHVVLVMVLNTQRSYTTRPMAADRGCPLDTRVGMSGYNVVIQNVYYSVCRFLRIHAPYTLKTPYIDFEK